MFNGLRAGGLSSPTQTSLISVVMDFALCSGVQEGTLLKLFPQNWIHENLHFTEARLLKNSSTTNFTLDAMHSGNHLFLVHTSVTTEVIAIMYL